MHNLPHVKADADDISLSNSDLAVVLESVIARGGCFRFKARGWSMSPFIKDGDVLLLSGSCADKYCLPIGTVAAFRCRQSATVVHRVIKHTDVGYLMKGDNNPFADGFIAEDDIFACVTRIERNGKRVMLGLGIEKSLIAMLSGRGLLIPLLNYIRHLFPRRA